MNSTLEKNLPIVDNKIFVKDLPIINDYFCKKYFLQYFGSTAIIITDEGQTLPYDKKYNMYIELVLFGKSGTRVISLVHDRYTFKFMKFLTYIKYYIIKLLCNHKYYGDKVNADVLDN